MAKKDRPRCGARCRTKGGAPCVAPVAIVDGKLRSRCRLHGGLSTGPRTAEGRARVVAGVQAAWARWRAGLSPVSVLELADVAELRVEELEP